MALSERDRRTVTIGGSVVGVLLAGFVLFSVLGGGEEPITVPDFPLPSSSPGPSPGGGGPPTQSFTGRDPFSVPPVLIPPPPPSSPGGGPTGSQSPSPSSSPT